MSKAKKVIASKGRVEKFGEMDSRAAVSLCGKFLFEGEYENPESSKRKALITMKDRVSGTITGKIDSRLLYYCLMRIYCLPRYL